MSGCDFATLQAPLRSTIQILQRLYTLWHGFLLSGRDIFKNHVLYLDDDLLALGVSIWELFVGRRLFEGLNGIATAQLIRKEKQ